MKCIHIRKLKGLVINDMDKTGLQREGIGHLERDKERYRKTHIE